ncbi:MAG: PQQ-dependent sugar dehydrogenase [Chloroflexales bacterium]|nr:PQQ-dependent sugar dehydrogenase [Chloroflexales bacterium]
MLRPLLIVPTLALLLAACGAAQQASPTQPAASTQLVQATAEQSEETAAAPVPTAAAEQPTTAAAQPTAAQSTAPISIRLEPVAAGFDSPLYATHAGDDSGRLFVVEKRGTIAIMRDGKRLEQPFLDIVDRVGSDASERGLLSVAFHPKYRENGLLFVYYTNKAGNVTISRFARADSPDAADPASEQVLLTVDKPAANHNGGLVKFGPDGYLYIGTGDGGRAGDPWGNAQNPDALLGKLLRIDVDNGQPYAIPADNPFRNSGGRPEIWATGLRNPWRFSFDRADGTLFIADVGQNEFEEINVQPGNAAGLNYGWNITEGQNCYQQSGCDTANLIAPAAQYSHDEGCSVTGGYVYRGAASPSLTGTYIFGDYCSGRVWAMRNAGGAWAAEEVLKVDFQLASFGEDQAGELYATGIDDGTLYKIVAE